MVSQLILYTIFIASFVNLHAYSMGDSFLKLIRISSKRAKVFLRSPHPHDTNECTVLPVYTPVCDFHI